MTQMWLVCFDYAPAALLETAEAAKAWAETQMAMHQDWRYVDRWWTKPPSTAWGRPAEGPHGQRWIHVESVPVVSEVPA